MANELTRKDNWYWVVTKSGQEFRVLEEEALKIVQVASRGGDKIVIVNGKPMNVSAIEVIEDEKDHERRMKLRAGMWECEFGKWHYKGQVCECGRKIEDTGLPKFEGGTSDEAYEKWAKKMREFFEQRRKILQKET